MSRSLSPEERKKFEGEEEEDEDRQENEEGYESSNVATVYECSGLAPSKVYQ